MNYNNITRCLPKQSSCWWSPPRTSFQGYRRVHSSGANITVLRAVSVYTLYQHSSVSAFLQVPSFFMCIVTLVDWLVVRHLRAGHMLLRACTSPISQLQPKSEQLDYVKRSLQSRKKIVKSNYICDVFASTIHVLLMKRKVSMKTRPHKSLTSLVCRLHREGEIAMQSRGKLRGVSRTEPRLSLRTHVRSTHDLSFPVNG